MITQDVTKVFKNGNSRAVRLPRHVLKSVRPGDELVVTFGANKITLCPKSNPRADWDEQFKQALADKPEAQIRDEWGVLDPNTGLQDGLSDLDDDWTHLHGSK